MIQSVLAAPEPTPSAFSNPVRRYLFATRPAFLSIALVGCVLGLASGADGAFSWPLACVTLALGPMAQAGVNVLNDYYDHLNGSDEANVDRVYPFTGGSRFIQNGVMSPRQTLVFGLLLFAVVMVAGLWLVSLSGSGLIWIGLSGLFIGWAYSAPPLQLNSRGLGEICVAAGFLLIVVGASFVQRGAWSHAPWLVGLPYALLVTNVLYVNQFPDREADIQAGKLHWVARLDPAKAVYGYWLMLFLAVAILLALIVSGELPVVALISLAFVPAAFKGGVGLAHNAAAPARLGPAIRMTVLAAHVQPLLLALALIGNRLG